MHTWVHSSTFKRQAEDIPHSLAGSVHLCTSYFYWQSFVVKCTESNWRRHWGIVQGSRLDDEPMAGKPKEKQLGVSQEEIQMLRQVMCVWRWVPHGPKRSHRWHPLIQGIYHSLGFDVGSEIYCFFRALGRFILSSNTHKLSSRDRGIKTEKSIS